MTKLLLPYSDQSDDWLQVNPHFAAYPEPEARASFPAESNALFRAYKYATEEIPWLNRL